MQYILTEEEYEAVESIESYTDLLASVKAAAAQIEKSVCVLETGGPGAYCDDCPVAHIMIKERYSNVRLCNRSKNFSK